MERKSKPMPPHIINKWLLDKGVINQKQYEARQNPSEEQVLCNQVEAWLNANESTQSPED